MDDIEREAIRAEGYDPDDRAVVHAELARAARSRRDGIYFVKDRRPSASHSSESHRPPKTSPLARPTRCEAIRAEGYDPDDRAVVAALDRVARRSGRNSERLLPGSQA
jgi:hypothetical protein